MTLPQADTHEVTAVHRGEPPDSFRGASPGLHHTASPQARPHPVHGPVSVCSSVPCGARPGPERGPRTARHPQLRPREVGFEL